MQKITTNLWFDGQAEEAAEHYVSIFGNGSRIVDVQKYTDVGPGEPGSVMTVAFELVGQQFVGINGGPEFTFNEAISLQIDCSTQEEVDYYWAKLTAGGGQEVQCGWLKDKYGLSWQVVPRQLTELAGDPDRAKANAVIQAMLGMKKLDIKGLQDAYDTAK